MAQVSFKELKKFFIDILLIICQQTINIKYLVLLSFSSMIKFENIAS